MSYVTAAEVRQVCGAPTALISDADIEALIANVESSTEGLMNTKFTPTQKIEITNGNNLDYIFTLYNPLLSVRELKTNSTAITPEYLKLHKGSGQIVLGTGSEAGVFVYGNNTVAIKYLYGLQEYSSTTTTLSTATTTGSAVEMAVASSTGIVAEDWVEIIGMDGYCEVAQVSSVDTGVITVDKLVYDHEADSVITLLQIPKKLKYFIMFEAGIAVALNAIGSTYTFNTNYGLGELSVTKGVPYPHFNTQYEKLIKSRDELRPILIPRPCIR